MSRDLPKRIEKANRGRSAARLPLKYAAMRESAFRFFRGTCHLFYEDLPRKSDFNKAPLTWITGDLHLENFGSFKGDDGQVYFDLNDFDEAVLAPCAWEIARTVTSIYLAAAEIGLTEKQARALAKHFVEAYRAALQGGKAAWIVQATASGPIGQLLAAVSERDRVAFLDRRTKVVGKRRQLLIDGKHLLKATPAERAEVDKTIRKFASKQSDPQWFEPLDVAIRIAGTGSLGVNRYVILVRGKGSPDKNHLLDLKEALPSSLQRRLKVPQPDWPDPAHRVVEIQQRMQAVSPAHLTSIRMGKRPYVLKELQPIEDRLDLAGLDKPEAFKQALTGMAQTAAWAQLRSSGRQGSAIADELIHFGASKGWTKPLLEYAEHYSRNVKADWEAFCKLA